ncbi:MAG: hypothetical protein ACR2GD_02805 [Pyrinomonadaceae bacterium]
MPDLKKGIKKVAPPEKQLKGNIVMHIMTATVSLILAIWLYSVFLGRENTPLVIYVTAAFLLAICGWQIQPLITSFTLIKHFKKRRNVLTDSSTVEQNQLDEAKTNELLPEADFSSAAPPGVTANTTRRLDEITRK